MDSTALLCYAKVIAITAGVLLMMAAAARTTSRDNKGKEELKKTKTLLVFAVVFNLAIAGSIIYFKTRGN